jgi:uncharacterized protein YktA (UPF0223 family)
MNFVLTVLPVVLAYSIFYSCVSGNEGAFYQTTEVVEKSKIKEPGWIRRKVGQLFEDEFELSSVDYMQDILNLPDGIRNAQKEAKAENLQLIFDHLEAKLRSRAVSQKIDLTKSAAFLTDLKEVVDQKHDDFFKVKDIYYEKVVDKSKALPKESYRVFTLIVVPKSSLKSVLENLSSRWQRSKDPSLRNLSKYLNS